jgi:hypothetical protein
MQHAHQGLSIAVSRMGGIFDVQQPILHLLLRSFW